MKEISVGAVDREEKNREKKRSEKKVWLQRGEEGDRRQVERNCRVVAARESVTRYVPNLNCAILRAGGDDIVVEGTPFDVQDRPLVTRDARIIAIDSSHLEKSLQRSYNNWKIPTEAK